MSDSVHPQRWQPTRLANIKQTKKHPVKHYSLNHFWKTAPIADLSNLCFYHGLRTILYLVSCFMSVQLPSSCQIIATNDQIYKANSLKRLLCFLHWQVEYILGNIQLGKLGCTWETPILSCSFFPNSPSPSPMLGGFSDFCHHSMILPF